MSEILDSLFGSRAKTRLLRFFLLNPEQEHNFSDLVRKNILSHSQARKELNGLKKIKFIQEKAKKGGKTYQLNISFPFYPELRSLIVKSNIYPQCRSLGRIRGVGDVKLALVSGVFLNYPKSKADIIMVADNVTRAKLKNVISNLEAEIGKEIRYALMTNEEFKYRMNMLDRFILEFFESPHEELVNKVPGLKRYIAGLKR